MDLFNYLDKKCCEKGDDRKRWRVSQEMISTLCWVMLYLFTVIYFVGLPT